MTLGNDGLSIFGDTRTEDAIAATVGVVSGDTFYVDDAVSASGTGYSWATAFATITEALAAAGNGDTIFVANGTYEEEDLIITENNLKLIGVSSTGLTGRVNPQIQSTTGITLVVRGNDVEISGFTFYQVGAFVCVMVGDNTSEVAWRTHIHDCSFDGDAGTYAISLGETTGEAVAAVVERCKFLYWLTACIYNNSENIVIQDCLFRVIASTIGIDDRPNGGDRPDRWFLDNRFVTTDSTNAIGIKITNTPSAGMVFMDGNSFNNFADDAHCMSKIETYVGINHNNGVPIPRLTRGKEYYVDAAVSASKGGLSWGTAFLTIAEALAAATNYDTIYVAAGTYGEYSLNIDQTGLKLIGMASTGLTRNSPTIVSSSGHIIEVDADDVEISGFFIYPQGAYSGIVVATSTYADAVWRTHIHDCHFDADSGVYSIILGWDSGACEAVAPVVERCKFLYQATGCIFDNGENVVIKDNLFRITAGKDGIVLNNNGGDRPDHWYLNNKFVTEDNTNAEGIVISNTPTAGTVMIDGNHFVYFNSNNACISKRTGYTGLNYLGVTAIAIT